MVLNIKSLVCLNDADFLSNWQRQIFRVQFSLNLAEIKVLGFKEKQMFLKLDVYLNTESYTVILKR